MALPPEPLEDVVDRIERALVGEVLAVAEAGDVDAGRLEDQAYVVGSGIGGAPPRPRQRVTVRIVRPLLGPPEASGDVELLKPESAYVLTPGMEGVFLIDSDGVILGRYGPRTWSEAAVAAALAHLPGSGAPTSGAAG